jgi:RNA polymerase sigma-70 factor (ECF subfamily)
MSGRILFFRPLMAVRVEAPHARAAVPGRKAAADDAPLDPREAERFRQALLPHLDAAYAFARFLARDPTTAEDLTQDAYLRAYRGFRGFRGGDAKAWLFAIVRSSFLTWARSQRDWDDMSKVEDTPAAADPTRSPEEMLVRQADDAAVRAAVDALPDPFREALVLRELQDMSYRQIAEITGAPIGTVMSRLARARQMLTVALGATGETR